MELSVLNIKGEDTGKSVGLDDSIFGITPNEHAVYLDVKNYLANKRQGTAKTKEKSEISASTKKIKKQKGTGTARAGSMKSPLFRGGGTIFGPKPRTYGFKLNKKVKKLARKSVLTSRAQENAISVIEDFTFDKPKTKEFVAVLKSLSLSDNKSLFVLDSVDKNIFLSSRNLPKVSVLNIDDICTYDIIKAEKLVLSVNALEKLKERLN